MPRIYPKTDLPHPSTIPLQAGDVVTYGLARKGADRRSTILTGFIRLSRVGPYVVPCEPRKKPLALCAVFLRTVRRGDTLIASAPYVLEGR